MNHEDIRPFTPERLPELLETVNASIARWPHCRPINAGLVDYWQTRPEYPACRILMDSRAGQCIGVLHGEIAGDIAHVHLLALRPGNDAGDCGERLLRQWERTAREREAKRIVSPTWRASLFYGGYVLGNEPYHLHRATAGTDAYVRSGYALTHNALIMECDLPREIAATPTPPGYTIVEVTPTSEYEADTFGFHAVHNGAKAAHCYARIYPHLIGPSGKPTGQIGNVTTEPEHRNRGLARLMVGMCLKRMQEMNVGQCLIATGLDNAPALRAYERCGFVRRHYIMEWSKRIS